MLNQESFTLIYSTDPMYEGSDMGDLTMKSVFLSPKALGHETEDT